MTINALSAFGLSGECTHLLILSLLFNCLPFRKITVKVILIVHNGTLVNSATVFVLGTCKVSIFPRSRKEVLVFDFTFSVFY